MTKTASSTLVTPPITSVMFEGPGLMALYEEPERPLNDGEFYVQTLYSGISAGTELTFFTGTNFYTSEGWDKELRLFRGDMEPAPQATYPRRVGYMECGIVKLSRNPDVKVGSCIAGNYGHTDGHVMRPEEFWVPLPSDIDPLVGIYASQMGPICMNGVLYAADELHRKPLQTLEGSLKGQRVMVFGAGIVGLLVGIFAKWTGASEVIIIDAIQERLDVAGKLGLTPMHAGLDLAVRIKEHWKHDDPLQTGADMAFQCTGSTFLLSQALDCLKVHGTVIDLGFYQQGTNDVFLGKEFHHNILRHVCAQIGSVPFHQKEHWSRRRLAEETIAFLKQHGNDVKQHLVTHQLPFSEAQDAFERLEKRDPTIMQIALYPDKKGTAQVDNASNNGTGST